jgi:hypothetical protein
MSTAMYLFLADLVLLLHILVVAFVVLGLVLILIGCWRGWLWIRNPWFRLLHVLCIGVVALQAWLGQICPLTILEIWLRSQGNGQVYAGSFISHWMESLLYYDAPSWVFTAVYTLFASLVLFSWIRIRPRPFRRNL